MYQSLTKIVTLRPTAIILFVLLVCLAAVTANASTLTTITVKEMDGVSTANYPLTFGHVFKEGDVTGNVYLDSYPTQTDVKTTYDDGSIRFAVISALVPMTANSDTVLNINTTGTAASTTPMTQAEMLDTDIGATIDLTGLSGSGYSGDLQADLRAAITAATSFDYWLEGGVCTEILIKQSLNNSLNASWEVRFYPDTSFIRISHVIENVEADYRGNINYAVQIKQGNTSPLSVYTKADFQHDAMSRWHKVFWLGTEPPEVEIHFNLDYIISTKMIPNYNTSLTMPETTLAEEYSSWQSSDHDIAENGIIHYYFPTTGGRQEIGILPTWTVRYLLSMDNRLKEIMLNSADLASGCPIHYRESDNTKAFYGHVLSITDRPTVRTLVGSDDNYGHTEDNLPSDIGSRDSSWTVDVAHQASFNYIPYLITGEKFYLDELYYWGGWNVSRSSYNSDWGRNYDQGYITGQVRAYAWGIRNLSDAAIMATDGSIEESYFNDIVSNNTTRWLTTHPISPLKFWAYDGDSEGRIDGVYSDPNDPTTAKYITAPWMNDFLTIVLTHMKDIGFATDTTLTELSEFTIGRVMQPDWNHFNAARYHFPALLYSGEYPQTWAQASALMIDQPTEFPAQSSATSYYYVMIAALSGIIDKPNGQAAYDFMLANWNPAGSPSMMVQYSEDPTNAIIPRGPKSAKNLRIE